MGNPLNRFKKELKIGTTSTIEDYISIINPRGDFSKVTGLNVIINSWRNILLTPKGSYTYDPTFGSNLGRYVFKTLDEFTLELIENEIRSVISYTDDRARLTGIIIEELSNGKGINIKISVDYKGESGELELVFDEESNTQFIQS